MSSTQPTRAHDPRHTSADDVPALEAEQSGILNVLAIPLRRWRSLLLVTTGAVIAAVPIALLQPSIYAARTVIVPVTERSSGRPAMMLGNVALPPGMFGVAGTGPSNQRLVTDILQSRALREEIATAVAPASSEQRAEILTVLRRMRTERSVDGTAVAIEVRAPDPALAARLANEVPAAVNRIVVRLGTEAASDKREFLLQRLEEARENLIRSENQLLDFQRERNLPEVGTQAERTVEAATRLQQAVTEQELLVTRLRRQVTVENPALRAAEADLAALRQQLQRLTSGRATQGSLLVPLSESAELRVAATRLGRDYARDEQVFISLTTALAETDIDARNEMPVVSVLDPAIAPAAPVPRRIMIVAIAALLGLVLGLAAAGVAEYAARARSQAANRRFFEAWDAFKHDIQRLAPGSR